MNIVLLDGYTLNPGDLDWAPLRSLGPCTIHERTSEPDILRRSSEAEILLTNKTPLRAKTILTLPALRYIGVLATGYDVVDAAAAAEKGIPVTNVPGYGTNSVAQLAFAHLLHIVQNVGGHADSVRRGRWTASSDYCYWETPLTELAGKTMGILGYGRIGQATAHLASAFGMNVITYDPSRPKTTPGVNLRSVSLVDLFRLSDVLSLHCPLTEETRAIVNREHLGLMKPGAILINTSRGPLVDEQALAEALHSGALRGAGVDVLSEEPPTAANPLLKEPHCFITPHIAWASREARERLLQAVVENIRGFLEGRPRNVVNGVA
jgi:glycerate dehydrogenase